jgi:hypothetical protein
MATQQTKGALGFLPEVSPEAAEANRRYMEAQRKLAETLDVRKNRTFDPMWLAAAQGFLGPTRTGSAFEALGRVAGNVGEAQAKEQELAKQIAGQELELAGAGIGLERMRQRDRAFQQMLGQGAPAAQQTRLSTSRGGLPSVGGEQPAQTAPQGALPASAQPAQQGALPAPPPALAGLPGQQVAPPSPDFMSAADFINISRFDPNADPAKIMKEAQELEKNRVDVTTEGAFDRATGMFYRFPKGERMERELAGTGQTYMLTPQQAILHDIYLSNNDPRYWDLVKQITEGPTRPGEPAAARPAGAGAPGAAPGAAPAAGRPAFRSKSQAEAEAEASTAYAKKIAEGSAAAELDIPKERRDAYQMRNITSNAQRLIDAGGQAIGIFSNPTFGDAIGTLVAEGIKLGPNAQISVPAVREAVVRMDPNVTQQQLNARVQLMSELANIELLFRKTYLGGQGAVSNMEGEVVRRLGGDVEMNPDVLREKMKLLNVRADFDLKRVEAWRQHKKKNPNAKYVDWVNSDEFIDLEQELDNTIAGIFASSPITSGQPAPKPAAPAAPPAAASRAPAAPSAGGDFASQIKNRADQIRKGGQQ